MVPRPQTDQSGQPVAAPPATPGWQSSPARSRRPSLGATILGRQNLHALKALMVLAEEPHRWRSVADLAASQALPAALLEQQLLRLRRAGLLQARRGRAGGYRLAAAPQAIHLAAVLGALRSSPQETNPHPRLLERGDSDQAAADRVTALLEARLWRTLDQELHSCTLAELLHDLRSARALLGEGGGWLLG